MQKTAKSQIIQGCATDVLCDLPSQSVQMCVTSPPYWGLRDYGIAGQIGAESELDSYIENLTEVFDEVYRVLKDDGTFWLNIGDAYTSGGRSRRAPDEKNPGREMSYRPDTPDGLKPKDLIGIPWRVAFALQRRGWYLRSDIIWHKPNAMPESVKDRPTQAHEYMFLLTKSENYLYNYEEAKELNGNGKKRNRRTVWSINTQGYKGAHFATFPERLIEPPIIAGSNRGDCVLDPFFGSGTVGVVCDRLNRHYVGIELNPDYIDMANQRLESRKVDLV